MGNKSNIEWTDATWNPTTGCTKVSAGCDNCYAEKMSLRLKAMGQINYINGFDVTLQSHMLNRPSRWTKPRRIFVNSMSDLFHHEVPFEYVAQVFDAMMLSPHHTFQILTKRATRMKIFLSHHRILDNVWLGVSVENSKVYHRIDTLTRTRAKIRFLSLEPLLGPLAILPEHLKKIDWIIVGGESGPGARPIDPEWVRTIRDQCQEYKVPFFFKQWGGVHKKENGAMLDGREWKEFPKG